MEEIKDNVEEVIDYSKYTFFWRSQSPFSQWYDAGFTLVGKHFKTAEHWMMYRKAFLFGDINKAAEILKENHPSGAKQRGREVDRFSKSLWEANCKLIVYKGNYAKFTQNEQLKKALLDTGDTILVEAAPNDPIWGIGMNEATARKTNPKDWKGTNWLGEILTQLREDLKQEEAAAAEIKKEQQQEKA